MGEAYLIDTSACSKYIQNLLSQEAADLMDKAFDEGGVLSVITRIELLSWVTGSRRLDDDIREFIGESVILELSEEIIQQTVKLRRHYKKTQAARRHHCSYGHCEWLYVTLYQ